MPTPEFFDGLFPKAAFSTIMRIKGRVGEDQIDSLFKNSLGGVMKMVYALVWQVL